MSRKTPETSFTLSRPRADLQDAFAPFAAAGVLAALDIHVAEQVGLLLGEERPAVLVALALATRAPRHGHLAIDLLELGDGDVLDLDSESKTDGAEDAEPDPLPWPEDRAAWRSAVAESPAVGLGPEPSPDLPFVLEGGLLYSRRYWSYETRLAAALLARFTAVQPLDSAEALRTGLTTLFDRSDGLDRQQLGAAASVLRGFTVVSGGPGTGKTYTVRSVLALLWAQWASRDAEGRTSLRVALAAPTGKAAARMKEALRSDLEAFIRRSAPILPPGTDPQQLRDFLDALQPATLHRLLGWRPSTPTRFRHDPDDPLPFDVVVVDEASMVDFALMTKLVEAVSPRARLILLGDRNQLASVEAGTVLSDLCGPSRVDRVLLSEPFARELEQKAGLALTGHVESTTKPGPQDCMILLDRSRRFGADSGIGTFARACLARPFTPGAATGVLAEDSGFDDVQLLPHGDRGRLGEAVEKEIVAGYRPYLERLLAGPLPGESRAEHHRAVLDAFDGFRVLCAHRRGKLGVEGLNEAVVRLLSSSGVRRLRAKGRFWIGLPLLVRRNDYAVGRFNGDIGIVVPGENGEPAVAFPEEGGGVSWLAPSRLPEHQSVFAMTIHTSQGSEFDHALVVLPDRPSPILTRELIYTGVTRAKRRMSLAGPAEVLEHALQRHVRRASGLQARLWAAT